MRSVVSSSVGDPAFDASVGAIGLMRNSLNFYEGIAIDRQGSFTEANPPKIPFWGVIRTDWRHKSLIWGVR